MVSDTRLESHASSADELPTVDVDFLERWAPLVGVLGSPGWMRRSWRRKFDDVVKRIRQCWQMNGRSPWCTRIWDASWSGRGKVCNMGGRECINHSWRKGHCCPHSEWSQQSRVDMHSLLTTSGQHERQHCRQKCHPTFGAGIRSA